MKKFCIRMLCLFIVLGTVLPNLAFADAVPPGAGPVADYPFDRDFTTVTGTTYVITDSTVNHYDAAAHGGVTWDAAGKMGGAAVLNGTDGYIELPGNVTRSADFTFAAWVKWDGTGGGWTRIFDFGGPGGFMYLTPRGAGDKLYFSIYQGTDQTLTGAAFPVNEWTHVAVTLEGDVGKLYVNGELQATNNAMTYNPDALNADANWLGKSRFAPADSNFSGSIDEVHIANRAWSENEIIGALIRNAPAPAANKLPKMDLGIVQDENKWTSNNTHDAELIKVNGTYYAFSTDFLFTGADKKYYPDGVVKPGIQIRKSPDLVHWQFAGRVFDRVSDEARLWSGNTEFWAPEVVQMNGKFYLYYSVSGFGTRNSYIGLATSETIEGPWHDEGAVLKTKSADDQQVNAIDPNIVFDADGSPWMAFGSFFGGIYIAKIDPQTGKLVQPGNRGKLIAKRQGDTGIPGPGIEGPNIIYNPDTGYYYLTVSYESLGDTYNVRVARSRSVDGPYVDYNGHDMIDTTGSKETGTKIINSYAFEEDAGWAGTGHDAWLKDGNNYYIAHNARVGEEPLWSELYIRKVLWTDDGWPAASLERYAGEQEQAVYKAQIAGEWEQIVLDRNDDGKRKSSVITLLAGGAIGSRDSRNFWQLSGGNTLTLHWYAPDAAPGGYWIDTVKIAPAWDWVKWSPTLVFTGLNQSGTAVWGKKLGELSDEGSVASAKENLSIGDVTAVKGDLALPVTGVRNTSIRWNSSNPDVVAASGKVNHPPFGSGNVQVTLTATIVKGAASAVKTFQVTVLPAPHEVIAKYSFNDSGNLLADSSVNHENPTAFGGVTYDAYGKAGGAVKLNGTDGYLKLPNSVTDTADFTFMAWVKWGGGGAWQRIFDFGGTGGFMFLTPSKGGEEKLYYTIYKGKDQTLMGGSALPKDTWTHVAVTIEDHTGTLYVDGQAVAVNPNMTINPQELLADSNFIGKSRFPDPTFNGSLDDVEILRKALTAQEIQERMNHPVQPAMDNGSGSGSSSGTGGTSGGGADGSSSGIAEEQAVVSEASFIKGADGAVSVSIAKVAKQVSIPVNVLRSLSGSSLELKKDGVSVRLPKTLMDKWLSQIADADKPKTNILVGMEQVTGASAELLKKPAGTEVRPAGAIVELRLQIAIGDSRPVTISRFAEGVVLKLKAGVSGSGGRHLQNVYAIADDGALEYVPGQYADGYFTAAVWNAGRYAVLEYGKSFSDVPDSHWASLTIKRMAAKQIAEGVTGTVFEPERDVTRGQFAAFLARTLGWTAPKDANFADVEAGSGYAGSIAALTEVGIISGRSDTRFAPTEPVTREEAAVMTVRAYEKLKGAAIPRPAAADLSDAAEASAWAEAYVAAAVQEGFLQGRENHRLAPRENITRAESMQLLLNLLSKQ